MPTKSLTTISTIADLITNDTLGDTGTSKGIALLGSGPIKGIHKVILV